MTTTQEWIDELKGISVLELSERIKALEEAFGVSAAAVAAATPLPPLGFPRFTRQRREIGIECRTRVGCEQPAGARQLQGHGGNISAIEQAGWSGRQRRERPHQRRARRRRAVRRRRIVA